MSLDIIVRRRDFLRSLEVLFCERAFNDEMVSVGQPLVFASQDRSALVPSPTFSLQPEDAQKLMDELWNCGVRPSNGSGSSGQLAAVESHRDDLQKIAMHLLKVPK